MQRLKHRWLSFCGGYRRLFAIQEIETESIVQWMFGASLFYFFVSFGMWIDRANITVETARQGAAVCWAYFPGCEKLYFLHGFPYGYSQSTLYMCFYGVMCLIVYLMWRKDWVHAHMLLLLLFLWKVFVVFVLTFTIAGPYDFYHIFLTAILLFVPFKEFFLKLAFVFFYFMSVTVKFSPGWVLGTYFTSMRSGMPLFYFVPAMFLTNLVIFLQVIDCWFLMSRNWILQRLSLAFGIIFHLYSGVLVFYNYPSVALPPLLILFGPMYRHQPIPFSKKSIGGWIIILIVGLFQLLGFVTSPDRFLTLEGHRFGMFMFEANHQCIVTFKTYSKEAGKVPPRKWSGLDCNSLWCTVATSEETASDGLTVNTRTLESASAWNRCDPYEIWTRPRSACKDPKTARVSMLFDHSINGGPFFRMIDEPDICSLTYKPFSHNEWIKVPPYAPVVGYPVENFYSL